MAVDLEEQVRSALSQWAQAVPERSGDPADVLVRARDRRRSRARRIVAVAALAVAAAVLVVAVVATRPTDRATPPADVTTEQGLGDPPTVIYRGSEPGWELARIELQVDPPSPTHIEYELRHDDGRTMQLNLYPEGTRSETERLPESPTVTVRGRPGVDTTYGGGRFRIDWNEAGKTWDVDGGSFDSLEALAAAVEGFEIVDAAGWQAWLPAEAASFVRTQPGTGFSWSSDDGLTPRPVAACPAPIALDVPLDPSGTTSQAAPAELEQVALALFPGHVLGRSSVVVESAKCRSRVVELSNSSTDAAGRPDSFVRVVVSDTPPAFGLGLDELRSTGRYLWENPGVVGVWVLTGSGRAIGLTAGHPDETTDALVRDPAFADQLRARVEELGY